MSPPLPPARRRLWPTSSPTSDVAAHTSFLCCLEGPECLESSPEDVTSRAPSTALARVHTPATYDHCRPGAALREPQPWLTDCLRRPVRAAPPAPDAPGCDQTPLFTPPRRGIGVEPTPSRRKRTLSPAARTASPTSALATWSSPLPEPKAWPVPALPPRPPRVRGPAFSAWHGFALLPPALHPSTGWRDLPALTEPQECLLHTAVILTRADRVATPLAGGEALRFLVALRLGRKAVISDSGPSLRIPAPVLWAQTAMWLQEVAPPAAGTLLKEAGPDAMTILVRAEAALLAAIDYRIHLRVSDAEAAAEAPAPTLAGLADAQVPLIMAGLREREAAGVHRRARAALGTYRAELLSAALVGLLDRAPPAGGAAAETF